MRSAIVSDSYAAGTLSDQSWGDECLLWIDYQRSDGSLCGLGVTIDRIRGGTAQAIGQGSPIESVAANAAKDPDIHVADIDLADARAVIAEGLRNGTPPCDSTTSTPPTTTPASRTRTCGPWWISGWACCPSAVTRPSRAA